MVDGSSLPYSYLSKTFHYYPASSSHHFIMTNVPFVLKFFSDLPNLILPSFTGLKPATIEQINSERFTEDMATIDLVMPFTIRSMPIHLLDFLEQLFESLGILFAVSFASPTFLAAVQLPKMPCLLVRCFIVWCAAFLSCYYSICQKKKNSERSLFGTVPPFKGQMTHFNNVVRLWPASQDRFSRNFNFILHRSFSSVTL